MEINETTSQTFANWNQITEESETVEPKLTAGVDLLTFAKDQRKDDVAQKYLAAFTEHEGVLFIGKAQEKASVFRTEKRRNADDGSTYPWIIRSTVPVNHYYVYILDRDFGPLFIKFCSYFPYAVKVCLNGHEWLKRQLTQRGIAYEPLDNGVRSATDAARVQRIANSLDATKIDAVFRKWLRRLPHPFTPAHRAAGYRYQLSILQAEFDHAKRKARKENYTKIFAAFAVFAFFLPRERERVQRIARADDDELPSVEHERRRTVRGVRVKSGVPERVAV